MDFIVRILSFYNLIILFVSYDDTKQTKSIINNAYIYKYIVESEQREREQMITYYLFFKAIFNNRQTVEENRNLKNSTS